MHWIGVALAAVSGFAVCTFVSLLIGLDATTRAECDGACLSEWDEVFYVSLGVGVLGAGVCAALTHGALRRRGRRVAR